MNDCEICDKKFDRVSVLVAHGIKAHGGLDCENIAQSEKDVAAKRMMKYLRYHQYHKMYFQGLLQKCFKVCDKWTSRRTV